MSEIRIILMADLKKTTTLNEAGLFTVMSASMARHIPSEAFVYWSDEREPNSNASIYL